MTEQCKVTITGYIDQQPHVYLIIVFGPQILPLNWLKKGLTLVCRWYTIATEQQQGGARRWTRTRKPD